MLVYAETDLLIASAVEVIVRPESKYEQACEYVMIVSDPSMAMMLCLAK